MKQIIFILIFSINVVIFNLSKSAEQQNNNKNIQNITKYNNDTLLKQIDNWQQQYWIIVKKDIDNSVCIGECDMDLTNKNMKELEKIEDDIKRTINKNNKYLKQLDDPIVQDKEPETQLEMNISAKEQLKKTDIILNKVYIEIKSKVLKEDFNKLRLSQRLWLKELEKYSYEIEKRVSGSIAPMLIIRQVDGVKYFRTLLLISYFENYNKKESNQKY